MATKKTKKTKKKQSVNLQIIGGYCPAPKPTKKAKKKPTKKAGGK
jgi:hypothetical protein